MNLTIDQYRMFKAAGCEPECHICDRKIEIGDWSAALQNYLRVGGGCSIVNGKIVPR